VRVDGGSGRPVPAALAAAALVVLVAVLVLLGLAARSGSYAPELPAAPTRSAAATAPPTAAGQTLPTAAPVSTDAALPVNTATGQVVLVLLLVAVAAGMVVLGVLLVRHRPRLRRGPPVHPSAVSPGSDRPQAIPEAVDQALLAVEQPDAREAVVQAWLRLGTAAAQAGTPARAAETATEYAERLAAVHGLPATSVHRLAALYREARFSDHPVRDDQRDAARAELTALRAALAAAPSGGRR
jgi:hypothetical protein